METSSEAFDGKKVEKHMYRIHWGFKRHCLQAWTSWRFVCSANMGNNLQERVQSEPREEEEVKEKDKKYLFIVFIRYVPPREKLRLCENQSRLMKPPASRPNLYYKQYEQKYWK